MKFKRSFLLLALFLTGCVYDTHALRTQVKRYEGDGIISDISVGSPPFFWSPGFQIVLPSFDPSKRCERSYMLNSLPKTKSKNSSIEPTFPLPYQDVDSAKKNATAVLSFTVTDADGVLLKSEEIVFKNAWWSGHFGPHGDVSLWTQKQKKSPIGMVNSFPFENEKRYTLRIVYEPGNNPPRTKKMYILVTNGGTI